MPIPSSSLSPPAKRASKPLRPKGLWRARAMLSAPRCIAPERKASSDTSDSDHDDEFESVSSLSSVASRAVSDFGSELDDDIYRWDFAQRQTCGIYHNHLPGREQNWIRRQRIMDSTSIAFVGAQTEMKTSCDLEDWMDLKDLFAKAAEQYETGTPAEAIPLLRGVVHECHTFLKFYQDPSVLFAGPRPASDLDAPPAKTAEKHEWCIELPTAFHAILGTALFLFGNLIDQDGRLTMSGEPDTPIPYWLAALDVFETGENLPSRVYGTGCDSPEDWRMAIVWGRTLVAIADATISQALGDPNCVASFSADDPSWPADSPFASIALRRPPLTRRMTLSTATPNDLMNLAMDQFSRGIFHMPHPQHALHVSRIFIEPPAPQPSCHAKGATTAGTHHASPSPRLIPAKATTEPFSRPKELFTIASEVMLLAEKLPHASERQFWASWADSVLNQMKMEADMDAWRGIISRTRGKCWLIAGSVHADELEDRLSQGDESVLDTANAAEARASLEKAVAFLEKGKAGSDQIEEEEERQKMLAEALYTLGNFTKDKAAQEALFARAEAASDDPMDVDP